MKIIKCDKCRKEVEKWYLVKSPGYTGNGSGYQGEQKDWDIREDCFKELVALINNETA